MKIRPEKKKKKKIQACTGSGSAPVSQRSWIPYRPEFFFQALFSLGSECLCLGSAHHCEDHFHSREILSWSLMGVKGLKSVLREIFEPGSKFAIQEF